MSRFTQFLLILAAAVWTVQATAEDAYFNIPLDKLELTEGSLPKGEKDHDWRNWGLGEYMRPYAVLDGEGEAYVKGEDGPGFGMRPFPENNQEFSHMAVRAPVGRDVTGRLFLPKPNWTGIEIVKFKIPASADKAGSAGN